MNKKYIKENKTLVKEFIGALAKAIVQKKADRFIPLGMTNFKKLSDFFIDQKYSILDKQNQWILCSGKDIVWIVGERIDDRYKVGNNTKKAYIARLL